MCELRLPAISRAPVPMELIVPLVQQRACAYIHTSYVPTDISSAC